MNRPDADELINLLTNVAQLLDGWHTDVAWTEWDESVRANVSGWLQRLYATRETAP